jgi:hypothetical protein
MTGGTNEGEGRLVTVERVLRRLHGRAGSELRDVARLR